MIALIQANVMLVGLDEREKVLRDLPIRITAKRNGREAARSLKNEKFGSVISKWDLEDMRDGTFLRKLRAIEPNIPTIAFVRSLDWSEEISARSIGVSAVLTQSCSDTVFVETVLNLLGLSGRKLAEPSRDSSRKPKRHPVREGIAE